jgi:2-C-methyl-D-erythritol 4-phosphate cytidylyltransferase
MTAAALIPAAGTSRRMGFSKLLTPLAGVPVLLRTLRTLATCAAFDELIVAAQPGSEPDVIALLAGDPALAARTRVVAGGATRVHSVWLALQAVRGAPDVVAVHDGARPFVAPAVVRAALDTAHAHGGALVAMPVVPTIKRVNADRCVNATLDRSTLWAAATPQAFRFGAFVAAFEHFWQRTLDVSSITDDCQIFELDGGTVRIVESNPENIKITTPFDWRIAAMLAAESGDPHGLVPWVNEIG